MKKKFLTINVLSVLTNRYLFRDDVVFWELVCFLVHTKSSVYTDWSVIVMTFQYEKAVKRLVKQVPELTNVGKDIDRLHCMTKSAILFGESVLITNKVWAEYWIDKVGEYIEVENEEEISNN
jgi:hypothetical protein